MRSSPSIEATTTLTQGADGIFGDKTVVATRVFQRHEGLVVDGVVGPNTLGRAHALGFVAFRRLRDVEVTPLLAAKARRLLALHRAEPYGSEYLFEAEGRQYLARLEQHYHEPGGPLQPWGYHPGISLFVTVTPRPDAPAHDEENEAANPSSRDPSAV